MSTPFLPLADVGTSVENEPFWSALRDDHIDLPFCGSCRSFIWYPRAICPGCHSAAHITWRTLPGTGRVYSYSVVAKGSGRWKEAGPYIVAYVELDSGLEGVDGPRILTNIVGGDARLTTAIDLHVRMVIDRDMKRDPKLGDTERHLLRFSLD